MIEIWIDLGRFVIIVDVACCALAKSKFKGDVFGKRRREAIQSFVMNDGGDDNKRAYSMLMKCV